MKSKARAGKTPLSFQTRGPAGRNRRFREVHPEADAGGLPGGALESFWTGAGRLGAKGQHQMLIQIPIDAPQLVVQRDVVCREAEPGQHGNEDEPVPDLKPPTNGFGQHAAPSGFDQITLPLMGYDEVASKLPAEVEDMHVQEVGQRVLAFVEEMLVKCRPGYDLAAMERQVFQDGILPGGQQQRFPGARD